MKLKLLINILFFATLNNVFAQKVVKMLQVPAVNEYCNININDKSVLPSGREVSPVGKTIRITKGAFGLAISPDQTKAIVLHNGVVTLVPLNNPDNAIRIPSYDEKISSLLKSSSFIGAAFSQDSKIAYLSGGDNGDVVIFCIDISFKSYAGIREDHKNILWQFFKNISIGEFKICK